MAGDVIRPEVADLMWQDRQKRENRLLGRLLQVFPGEPLELHQETIEQTVDAMTPQIMVATTGRTYFGLGRPIVGQDERPMVVVEHGHTGQQTVFYRSKSHAVWRAMLGKAFDGYIPKGMFGAENSTDAPIALQRSLSKVAEADPVGGEAYEKVILALVNDRPDIGGSGAADMIAEGKMHSAWMELSPQYTSSEIASGDPDSPFAEGKEPVLGEPPVKAWTFSNPLYGSVTSRVYPSADGTLNYMINSTSPNNGARNQHWIGTVEVAGKPVVGLGLTRNFVQIPEAFLEPPIDYEAPGSNRYGERRWKMTDLEALLSRAGVKAEL